MNDEDKLLLLIDGSGFIFRAYHKLPPMNRADGLPTGAVYGFTAMLLKLREELPASHAVVVFDAKGDNFRHALLPTYKANRPPAPEDLIPQFPLVRDAAEALNMAIIEQTGVEADDIIATYAKQASEQGLKVCVVSSDKDLMQLLQLENVTLYDPLKAKYINHDDVFAKFGVTPAQVPDVQAIMGDSTDNIAGIKGIGAKGAAELVQQFGSLEAMFAGAKDIAQKKRRELVLEQSEQARLSMKLVLLKDDVADLPDIADYVLHPIDAPRFSEFCAEMNFKTLERRVREKYGNNSNAKNISIVAGEHVKKERAPVGEARGTEHNNYILIQELAHLQQVIAEIEAAGVVAFDCETTSLDAMQAELVGFSLCTKAGKAYYVPLAHKCNQSSELFGNDNDTHSHENNTPKQTSLKQIKLSDAITAIKPILNAPHILKIGQNIKYDTQIMRHHNVEIAPYDDTMLMSYSLNAGAHLHGMDAMAERLLGITIIKYNQVTGTGKAKKCFSEVGLEEACNYAAEDADITLQLYQQLRPQLLAAQACALYERIERPLPAVVARMEAHGVRINALYLNELSRIFEAEMQILAQQIYADAGLEFNIASPKQLGEILFDKLQLSGGKKSSKTGAYVTDAETLEELASQHPLPAKIVEWRQLAKLKSTYSDSLPKQINPRTQRVHTSYSLASTTTGRLSSTDPNLQNIPIRTSQGRLIRQAFIADDGFSLLCADYSQIELRLLAHIADITPLKDAFAQKIDVHAVTASQMFGVPIDEVDFELRRKAKTINFGIIYGISAHGLSARLGIPRGVAAEYIAQYFKQYAGIAEYMAKCKEQAKEQGYVSTLWGRRCHLPMINDKNGARRAFAERAAINAPLQGSAADIIKLAMIAVDELLTKAGSRTRMLLQVHDELMFELAHDEHELIPQIRRTMEQVAHLSVPLLVEVGTGKSWGDAH